MRMPSFFLWSCAEPVTCPSAGFPSSKKTYGQVFSCFSCSWPLPALGTRPRRPEPSSLLEVPDIYWSRFSSSRLRFFQSFSTASAPPACETRDTHFMPKRHFPAVLRPYTAVRRNERLHDPKRNSCDENLMIFRRTSERPEVSAVGCITYPSI